MNSPKKPLTLWSSSGPRSSASDKTHRVSTLQLALSRSFARILLLNTVALLLAVQECQMPLSMTCTTGLTWRAHGRQTAKVDIRTRRRAEEQQNCFERVERTQPCMIYGWKAPASGPAEATTRKPNTAKSRQSGSSIDTIK